MNKELILKIRREAITKWASNHNITVHKFLDEPDNIESLEIFAELIIQECISQVKLELRNNTLLLSNPPQNGGVWDACNNIRRHFGVK